MKLAPILFTLGLASSEPAHAQDANEIQLWTCQDAAKTEFGELKDEITDDLSRALREAGVQIALSPASLEKCILPKNGPIQIDPLIACVSQAEEADRVTRRANPELQASRSLDNSLSGDWGVTDYLEDRFTIAQDRTSLSLSSPYGATLKDCVTVRQAIQTYDEVVSGYVQALSAYNDDQSEATQKALDALNRK